MDTVVRLWRRLIAYVHERTASGGLDPEAGQAVNEWLGLSALAIVAIVAIGGALEVLGVDVVNWIRGQLGI